LNANTRSLRPSAAAQRAGCGMKQRIGTCSICGGPVSVPRVWFGVVPPTPKCESCGAVKRDHGPVIDMKPKKPRYDWMDHAAGFSVIDKLLGR
jgi:hypothetical protein